MILYHIDEFIRKVKAEKMETNGEGFNNRNRYLSVYHPFSLDFILSRMYVIREVSPSSMAFIFPDPAADYDHGTKNNPIPYVICIPRRNDAFRRTLTKIIRTLCCYHKIVISRVYPPNMCLDWLQNLL